MFLLMKRNHNHIVQKQIDVILPFGIPVKPVSIIPDSFLHFRKILLYIFFLYIQYFILCRSR